MDGIIGIFHESTFFFLFLWFEFLDIQGNKNLRRFYSINRKLIEFVFTLNRFILTDVISPLVTIIYIEKD